MGHSRVLNVVFSDGRYGLSGKTTDYIVPEAMFLPVLKMLIPERAQWNGGVLQGQRGIPIFTDGSKLGGGTGAGVFCRELGLELQFRLNACSVFQVEIFAILNAIVLLRLGSDGDLVVGPGPICHFYGLANGWVRGEEQRRWRNGSGC